MKYRMKLSKSKKREIYGRTDIRKTKKVRINFKMGYANWKNTSEKRTKDGSFSN